MVLTEADIAVFVGTLLISISAGIFYAIKDKKKYSTENYYFGGRKLSPIPVAASLSVSYVSAIAIVAIPVEVYMYGSVYAWDMLAGALSKLVAAACFLPIYHKLKLSSVYEYLELRFNKTIRLVASFLAWTNLLMYLGVVLYLPALSLSATTSLTVYAAIATTGIICTFYTTIGGVKAVIWTDLLQSFMMVAGILGLFISTVMSVGGIEELIGAVKRGGRDNLLSFDPDPRIRSSFWTVTVGSTINGCYNTCCSQVYVQRYLSCKNKKTART